MEDEEKGAIDTADDNSGAAPVMPVPDDNSGAPPVMPSQPAAPQQPAPVKDGYQAIADAGKQNPVDAAKQFPGNARRIISYLMGADAAHPQALDQAGAAVDPQGSMSPGDRNLMAIEQAVQQGGPQAGWPLVQANRVAYNAKQSFAKVALEGTQQKPADLRAAVDAANQAQAHVLDGSNIQFAATPGGVTATVTMPGGQPQQIALSPQAFAQWLDVGGDGQWDKVVDHSAPATLQRLAGADRPQTGMATVGAPAPRKYPQSAAPAQPQDAMAQDDAGDDDQGAIETDETKTGKPLKGLVQAPSGDAGYGEELENRSKRIFGAGAIGPTEAARQQWMAAQEEKELERGNRVDVASEKGRNAIEVARQTGASRVAAATTTAEGRKEGWKYASDAKLAAAQIAADQKAAHDGNVDARARIESARKAIATKRMTGAALTPEDEALEKRLVGDTAGRPAAQQGRQQAPAQGAPQRPANVPQGAKFYKGSWYTRGPNGESVPVQ